MRIDNLLSKLGYPNQKFKSIHVAGTSGKGSTAFSIAQLLKSQQTTVGGRFIKVGLHVSPHLVDIRERMQIFDGQNRKNNGERLVSIGRFVNLFNEVKLVVDDISSEQTRYTPSYFEILVAASFKYFAEEKVDWAVVEVGLGGRLDATNVLNPEVCVITNIGFDHTEILGNTLQKIAAEKAGIVKTHVPVVTAASGQAFGVIEKVADEKNAPLYKFNTQDFKEKANLDVFRYYKKYIDVLRYIHKGKPIESVFLAFGAVLLALKTFKLPHNFNGNKLQFKNSIELFESVFNDNFPGRFEEIDFGVILDGAHNPDKIKVLVNFIKETKIRIYKHGVILVLAFKKGKKWKGLIDFLMKNLPVKEVIATQFYSVTDMGAYQSVDPVDITKYIILKHKLPKSNVKFLENAQEAVWEATNEGSLTGRRGTGQILVLVTGSLYLVGEARTIWHLPEF